MHDEQGAAFDPVYGRMSSSLGVEDPAALTNAQNVYLYPFINPATEVFKGIVLPPGVSVTPISSAADGTQIWKITHNGVDTHAIHWHLYDVQVLNRTGWDGFIRPPDPTELGWKETVRVSPLEDTFVAMRPIIPKLPFGVPNSVRPLDPMMPLGSTVGFNQAGPGGAAGGAALNIVNKEVSMGWEYVWHCHMLSHEEMDMMRPVEVEVQTSLPVTPLLSNPSGATFTWTDGSPVGATLATWGDPRNEIGYRLERSLGLNGSFVTVRTTLANVLTATDSTMVPGATYRYRVVAFNASGNSASAPITVVPATYALTGLVTATVGGVPDSAVNNAKVTVYTAAGVNVKTATTNGSGAYSVAGLAAGTYKVYIQPPSNLTGYSNQWLGGATQGSATVVTIAGDTSIDIPLVGTPSFTISGTVITSGGTSPGVSLTSARVSVYNATNGASLATVTSTGGTYTITRPPGTYKLYITTNRSGYPNQWWGGTSLGTATVITVTNANVNLNLVVHI